MEPSTAVKLEKLLIGEVSGVDDPANQIPGWMVTKGANPRTGYPIGPVTDPWDVGAAEQRIRAHTNATDAPNPLYASCFLWKNGSAPDADGDGVPDEFGDYKFLVCDVVDDKISVMPSAVRAARARLGGSTIPARDKESIGVLVKALEVRTGLSADDGNATTLVEKIKGLLFPTTSREEIDMTSDELVAVLDAKLAPVTANVDALSKSVEALATSGAATSVEPTSTAGGATPAPDEGQPVALTAEDLTKAFEAAVQPILEVIDKTLDRVVALERSSADFTRKSLTGQESNGTGEGEPAAPSIGDAIAKALRNPSGGQPTTAATA